MKDQNGKTISYGQKMWSTLFKHSGPIMKCLGYQAGDGNIILAQDRKGEMPIYLTQEQLIDSNWVLAEEEK